MRKLRNFFLAVFGFFLLSILVFAFSELVWENQDTAAAVASAPPTAVRQRTTTPEGNPIWLISDKRLSYYCDHPWVVRKMMYSPIQISIDNLRAAGLSECYQLAGERAVESHLWHQGITFRSAESGTITDQARNIELFFEHNADFEHLGLEAPHTTRISGAVVHDLNGDAFFNPGEKVIPNAEICINRHPLPPLCTRSDSMGRYSFDKILPGAWHFQVISPTDDRLAAFKYTNQLIKADHQLPETRINGYTITQRNLNLTEFNPIEKETLLLVDREIEHNFFLMHEWATYFAAPKDADQFQIKAYYDLEVRPGWTRVYNGAQGLTYDQHDGLDASCPTGTEIVSVAEGRVVAILYDSTVAIQHANQLISIYGHGDPLVVENQYIPRGYPVALCNNHLTESGPHVHFAVWRSTPWLHSVNYVVPPFADLAISEEKWVANHAPLEEGHFVYLLQGGRGIWTEINQPHLPYVDVSEE